MVKKQSQKEAVYAAVVNVLAEHGIKFEDGMDVAPLMTRERRAQVNQILFEGFRSGSIELNREFTDSELAAYVSGLQSNWIRKDKRLNGGVQYVAKNPGSRAGSSDPQIKALRALLSTLTSEEERAEVQSYIDARLKEIAASKAKPVSIDFSSLPADLRHKFQK
jgi:hypothetical protein